MTLKMFKATFPGLWLSGHAVVLAKDPAEAAVMLRAALDASLIGGLDPDAEVGRTQWTEHAYAPGVVYLDTGNY